MFGRSSAKAADSVLSKQGLDALEITARKNFEIAQAALEASNKAQLNAIEKYSKFIKTGADTDSAASILARKEADKLVEISAKAQMDAMKSEIKRRSIQNFESNILKLKNEDVDSFFKNHPKGKEYMNQVDDNGVSNGTKSKAWSTRTRITAFIAFAGVVYGFVICAIALDKFLNNLKQLTIVSMTVPDQTKPYSAEITFTPDYDLSGFTVNIMGDTDILPETLNSWDVEKSFRINNIIAPNKINLEVTGLKTPATKGKLLIHTNWDDAFKGAADDATEPFEKAFTGIFDDLMKGLKSIVFWVLIVAGVIGLFFLIKFIIKINKKKNNDS